MYEGYCSTGKLEMYVWNGKFIIIIDVYHNKIAYFNNIPTIQGDLLDVNIF